MPYTQTHRPMSVPEWIAYEETTDARHDYIDGECRELWPLTVLHAQRCTRLGVLLFEQTRKTKFQFYGGSLRIGVEPGRCYLHPNGSIFDAEPIEDLDDPVPHGYLNPRVIFEVVEEETLHYDAGRKFEAWRSVPSVREILLIDTAEPRVHAYEREEGGGWSVRFWSGLDAVVPIRTASIGLPLGPLYEPWW